MNHLYSLFRSLQLAVFLHFPQQDQAKSQYQQVPGGFRTMVKLIERPRQKGEQIPYDPGEDHRVAKGRQYPLPCVFEREHSLPDQHKHHGSEQYIAEEIGGQHRSSVSKKTLLAMSAAAPTSPYFSKVNLKISATFMNMAWTYAQQTVPVR
ncbi:MAG: hypothetical protein MR740_01110 [Clostridium sp.]|nr:hypothetical protein [Clostridium sp.]